MKARRLKAPFPWFGGKSRVADLVWDRFGDVLNYVEPFAGSLAVLLGRPTEPRTETVNDKDSYIANFWRAVQNAPAELAAWCDWPVNEADMHARHLWLVNQVEFRERMKTDPDYFDVKIAGWWVWGISQWIGGGWCSRPEWSGRINVSRAEKGIHQQDVSWRGRPAMRAQGIRVVTETTEPPGPRPRQKRPRLSGFADSGVHAAESDVVRDPRLAGQTVWKKRPILKRSGSGVVKHQLPDLGGDYGATGRGVHASARIGLEEWMYALQARLRRTRVCCGDWKRILGRSPTECIGTTAVFLDPPYSADRDSVYSEDDRAIAPAVAQWAIEHGHNPMLRIALCGYVGEHEMPPDWTVLAWKTNGGHGNAANGRGRANSAKERIWFSPHCLAAKEPELWAHV
jgi:hypothetical protein